MRLSIDSNILDDTVLTLQSLAEFRHVTVRKRLAPPHIVASQYRALCALCRDPVPASIATLERALLAWDSKRFSFWDSMLLAAAASAGCEAIISEDMTPGAELDGLRVVGAFDPTGGIAPAMRDLLGLG